MHGNMNVKSIAALIQILRNQIFRARGVIVLVFVFQPSGSCGLWNRTSLWVAYAKHITVR